MPAAYDDVADRYADWARSEAAPFMTRTGRVPRAGLGPGSGLCWDLAGGTGIHSEAITAPGWTLAGSDISSGQLRHARAPLPVVPADATALPLPDASCAAVASVLCHTDITDYATACREAPRVLIAGGAPPTSGSTPASSAPTPTAAIPTAGSSPPGTPTDPRPRPPAAPGPGDTRRPASVR